MARSRRGEKIHPADRVYAKECLERWGKENRRYGPRGYPRKSAHVPTARGIEIDWQSDVTEIVGRVVKDLHPQDRERVTDFYIPHDGQQCNASATMARLQISRDDLLESINYCAGLVYRELSSYGCNIY